MVLFLIVVIIVFFQIFTSSGDKHEIIVGHSDGTIRIYEIPPENATEAKVRLCLSHFQCIFSFLFSKIQIF